MRTAKLLQLILTIILVSVLSVSCSKKKKGDGAAEDISSVSEADISAGTADSDSGKAMGLHTIYFGFDSALLDSSAKSTLKENARILKANPSVKIQVEGHTDERGGIQYNIALGERRAHAVQAYLKDQGIKGSRVTIVSYGKEKPISFGHDEESWAKNRRGNFRITGK